ncbi:MAG: hypothetical protein ACR2GP_15635 [Burkholderiaceae bacterium]
METGQREIAVTEPEPSQARGYDTFYERFDAPLMQRLRQEAYGQDIGQHSWVTVEELAQDIVRLQLARASRLLDLDPFTATRSPRHGASMNEP